MTAQHVARHLGLDVNGAPPLFPLCSLLSLLHLLQHVGSLVLLLRGGEVGAALDLLVNLPG
jgi:hypothetical protein